MTLLDFSHYFTIGFTCWCFSIVGGAWTRSLLQDLSRSAFLHIEKHVFLMNASEDFQSQIQRSFNRFMEDF